MHTKQSLINDIKNAGIINNKTLMIHSSMKSIGEVEGGAETVLDSFIEYMKEGLLLFPTHSWSKENLKNNTYDYKKEPSCVGILPNLFLKRDGAYRSMHPTHSVTAMGEGAIEYIKKDDYVYTPCKRYGCFGSLYDVDAQILFLGAPLTTNTFIHSIEEWLEIPNRLSEKPRVIIILEKDGSKREIDFYEHSHLLGDVSKNYDKIESALLYNGYAHTAKIGDAFCYVVKARPMADMVISFLKKDPDLFSNKRE